MASELFVVCYPAADVAEQVLKELRRLEAAHLLRLEDCVIVNRADDGRLSMHRSVHQKLKDTALGLLLGAMLGKWFGAPLLGAGLGAAGGAIAKRLPDTAIDEGFVRELTQRLAPNSSAIFGLIPRFSSDRVLSAPDKVVPELGRFGGTVLHTTLSAEAEESLQAAIDKAHLKEETLRSATLTPRHAYKRRLVNPTRSRPASTDNNDS
jgi:uncharacterized membrane protein